jgi:hypothetical protein
MVDIIEAVVADELEASRGGCAPYCSGSGMFR